MSRAFAGALAARGWSGSRIALFDAGFARYWMRSASLASRTTSWPPPRRRHVAVVADPRGVRPYVSLLNTSAWLLYAADADPECSDPEFLACLLAHGDWMAQTGEVALAAVRGAAWWLERATRSAARSPPPRRGARGRTPRRCARSRSRCRGSAVCTTTRSDRP